jgi:hypothetical protein
MVLPMMARSSASRAGPVPGPAAPGLADCGRVRVVGRVRAGVGVGVRAGVGVAELAEFGAQPDQVLARPGRRRR